MATIKQNVEKLRDAIMKDAIDREKGKPSSTFTHDIRDAAVAAIRAGVGTEQWRRFMTIFADNSKQLALLSAKDDDPVLINRKYAREISAYLAGGVMCTDPTTTHLPPLIDAQIDNGLSDEVEADFEKVIPFPPA